MKGGTVYNQKEIVLLPFPYSDLTGAKQRPALIISNERLNKTSDRICCLITSNQPKDGILIDQEDIESGRLPFKSWIKPYRLFTIHEKIIKKRIRIVTNNFHYEIVNEISQCIKKLKVSK